MRSRLQQKRRRQSKRRQTIRRGGRPEIEYKLWQVSYEVLCNEDTDVPAISASDLFSMVNTGLYEMATGHGDPAILGAENIVISKLTNREEEVYKIKLNVSFDNELDAIGLDELNEWKVSYLDFIQMQGLFQNNSFVPIESTFNFKPISEEEYLEY